MKWLKIIVTSRARSCSVGSDIKWYDSYEEIQAIIDFIDWCENEIIEVEGKEVDASEYYRFVRIGEEMDDNEVQGWGFDIHIERTATY